MRLSSNITDDEIDFGVSSNTPTAVASPAPEVLEEMYAARRREHLAALIPKIARGVAIGYVIAGATAGLLSLVIQVGR
jgi:hypothetical protein